MAPTFEIAGGTVTGQAHVAAGRNNQDAFSWEMNGEGLVAVVCDGCGSAPHSEVGAKLGARLITQAGARRLASACEPAELLEQVRLEVLDRLRLLATDLAGGSSPSSGAASFARTVLDYLLFTAVGAIVTPRWATTFSLGDGLAVLNGDRLRLGPFPENEPPYLSYALLSGSAGERPFEIHRQVPVDEARSLLLATDGAVDLEALAGRTVDFREAPVGPLSQFWAQDRFFANRDMLRRRLAVVSRGARSGLLPDDTTVVVARRKGEPS